MYRIVLFLILILSISCKNNQNKEIISAKPIVVSNNELVNYIEYCNNRFDICILYPSNFDPLPEPINGDGRTFTDEPDNAEITVYGSNVSENYNLEDELNSIKSYVNISEIIDLPNGFEILGTEKDSDLILHKIIIIKNKMQNENKVNILHNLTFTYPNSKKKKFKSYWKIISQQVRT
ncbi:hypothetical protein KRX57_10630 [Weeksellaceae bacterium TAE3-ERU29]|nr:hypothetical protein [Weeksellaceae bacterium TAE3-ERU29]